MDLVKIDQKISEFKTNFHDFLLQGRVVKPPPTEKSYHIFYQMLAGLNQDERHQLGLDNFSVRDFRYLNVGDTRQDMESDSQRFCEWRSSLGTFINHVDMMSGFF